MLTIQSELLFQETSVRARASHVELFLTNGMCSSERAESPIFYLSLQL